jgi:hypothetical protein
VDIQTTESLIEEIRALADETNTAAKSDDAIRAMMSRGQRYVATQMVRSYPAPLVRRVPVSTAGYDAAAGLEVPRDALGDRVLLVQMDTPGGPPRSTNERTNRSPSSRTRRPRRFRRNGTCAGAASSSSNRRTAPTTRSSTTCAGRIPSSRRRDASRMSTTPPSPSRSTRSATTSRSRAISSAPFSTSSTGRRVSSAHLPGRAQGRHHDLLPRDPDAHRGPRTDHLHLVR